MAWAKHPSLENYIFWKIKSFFFYVCVCGGDVPSIFLLLKARSDDNFQFSGISLELQRSNEAKLKSSNAWSS